MTMAKRPDMTLHRRAQLMQQKFAHLGLHYAVADLEERIESALKASFGACPLCGLHLSYKDMGLDHALPLSRGGTSSWANVAFVHQACNRAKGDLTTEEYMRLLSFLHELGPVAEKSVLSRLKASGYAYYRR